MARQTQVVEVNKFNAGLITDASPLTTPENSSLEEDNMVLNVDGSRNRRFGMDYEEDFSLVSTTVTNTSEIDTAITTFKWNNAGGDPERSISVIQFGNQVKFFNLGNGATSDNLIHTETFTTNPSDKFSFASVDGILVIVNGSKDIYLLQLKDNIITRTTKRLLIRDLFGVEDIINGVDMFSGGDVSKRQSVRTDAHIYNLRNQTWAVPRIAGTNEYRQDPIGRFRSQSGNNYPSNSDTVNYALYPDPGDSDNRVIERFFASDLINNPPGSAVAPKGYFIIDALDRGTSRLKQEDDLQQRHSELDFNVTSLPLDETPKGATTITEFAGRVWYGGFTGEVIGGDGNSPKLSSYVFFSRVVENIADINMCYQDGDPTSKVNPDIIATDGGFIRINEAYGIKRLINLGSSLMVVAANGIWRVVGGDNGFTATQYIVDKLTDRGCSSSESIAVVDNTFMFWSDDGIYNVAPDQFGSWGCTNISFSRIQKFYDDIDISSKRKAVGAYDSYERKIRWLYDCASNNSRETKELVLDIQLQAFYTNTIKKFSNVTSYPKVVSMYIDIPYRLLANDNDIVVGNDQVQVGTEKVILISETYTGNSQRELGYIILTSDSPTASFTFGKYSNTEFREWFSVNNVGVDAEAYMITSYLSGGDHQRDKQVMYMTVHLLRTENGYTSDMVALNQSSCLVQARWGWSNSDNSGKWGREFQAYRYRKGHLPLDQFDKYDTGFETIVSRNKLRGSGRVLSLRFRTEPYKNLHLYGWSMIFSMKDNV